ncbi:hypothetical protein IMF27_24770 [Pseudomonas sp. PCH199]|uniref:hypothetical protein n=1 Tax=unclassified Pseudomonas TaxID=196821 RepID=UPI000BC628EC|nr:MULTISPECIES: hypothetical protein [unclassified Pseudomonas]MCW8278385.1 hypothetical protein [Pseudomonas sp. PCH199]PAM81493.1 hypothetical protein CES87_25285 [Pseudomonas sp. ERMR1:02]
MKGSAKANRIVSRGQDRIHAGAGDDTIYLLGGYATAAGGTGKDQYYIAHKSGTVTIKEEAGEESLIIMDWPFESIQKWSVEDTSLVVSSLCGKDGEWPERKLIIKDVYKSVGNKHLFQEQKMRFLTLDGFQLAPDFPDELNGANNHSIEILILVKGKRPAPMIITSPEHEMTSGRSSHFFIDRDINQTLLKFIENDQNNLKTIHIDCDSEELTHTQATYTVQVNTRNSNDYLAYSDFSLQLFFKNKTIILENLVTTSSDSYTNIRDTSYMVKGLRLNQALNLTMRDGVSFRLKPPSLSYFDDVNRPGFKKLDGHYMLEKRAGSYLLLSPEDSRATELGQHPQRVEIPAHVQNKITLLEGKGSTYHIHFYADTLIRISTPGAFTKTSNASTWYFYSRYLDPATIRLSGKKLLLGRTIVHLPEYKNDDTPVEEIFVITASGVMYAVDLIFEQVYLYPTKQ